MDNTRRHIRHKIDLPLLIGYENADLISARAKDLSVDGMRIAGKLRVPDGEWLEIYFVMHGDLRIMDAKCIYSASQEIGVQFLNPQPEELRYILKNARRDLHVLPAAS